MKIAFLGDISLNNGYEIDRDKSYFQKFADEVEDCDYVIGNLECLAYGKDVNHLKKPRLGTTKEALEYLSDIKVNLVTLAHNHVYDNLFDGFLNTTAKLEELEIDHIGATITQSESYRSKVLEKDGIKIGFLNYVTDDTNPSLPEGHKIYLNLFNESIIKDHINNLKGQVDQVVLLLHWGGRHEGASYPDSNQRLIAERLFSYGADLIVGHHSHVIQPQESFGQKQVFYSLGNFCFDNIVSDGRTKFISKKQKKGALLKIDFKKTSYSQNVSYLRNKNLEIVTGGINDKWRVNLNQRIFNLLKRRNAFYKLVYFNLKSIYPFYYFFLVDKSTWRNKIQRILKKILPGQ